MKKILIGMLMAAMPQWLSSTLALDTDDDNKVTVHVARVADGDAVVEINGEPAGEAHAGHVYVTRIGEGDGHALVKVVEGDGEAHANCKFVVKTADGEEDEHVVMIGGPGAGVVGASAFVVSTTDEDGEGEPKVLRWVTESGEPKGWLGVSIGKVEGALAEQLEMRGKGVAVVNVVKASPAEVAGIEAHDIIVSVGGVVVTGDVAKVVELVGSHAPGDEIDVIVLRQGKEKNLTVELGTRAGAKNFEWKFDIEPLAEIEENVFTRGKMIQRDDEGNWIVKELGDLHEIPELAEKLKLIMPGGHSHSSQLFVDGNRQTITIETEDDGGTLIISQEDGGEISVTRTDDGEETTVTYDDEEALEAGDEEAFVLFNRSGKPLDIHMDLSHLQGISGANFDIELDLDDLHEHLEGLGEHLELIGELDFDFDFDHFGEAGEAYREAMDQAREAFEAAMEQWKDANPDGRSDAMPSMELPFAHGKGFAFGIGAKPKHSFKLNDDGSIVVSIRRGDSELVREYTGEGDLAKRDPKLYDKYEALKAADDE